jgi:membrane protein
VNGTRPRIKELNIGLLAAGVAFWGFLSIFPAMIALIMLYGLVSSPQDATRQVDNALTALPGDVRKLVGDHLASVAATRSGALSIGLVISIIVLLWSTSSGMQNLMRALSTAYEQRRRAA